MKSLRTVLLVCRHAGGIRLWPWVKWINLPRGYTIINIVSALDAPGS